MEDIDYLMNTNWHSQCLNHCESYGISKTIFNLFIHLRGENHAQDNEKTTNSRISNKSDYDSKEE